MLPVSDCGPGWRKTMWGKVSCLRKQPHGRNWALNHRSSDLKFNEHHHAPTKCFQAPVNNSMFSWFIWLQLDILKCTTSILPLLISYCDLLLNTVVLNRLDIYNWGRGLTLTGLVCLIQLFDSSLLKSKWNTIINLTLHLSTFQTLFSPISTTLPLFLIQEHQESKSSPGQTIKSRWGKQWKANLCHWQTCYNTKQCNQQLEQMTAITRGRKQKINYCSAAGYINSTRQCFLNSTWKLLKTGIWWPPKTISRSMVGVSNCVVLEKIHTYLMEGYQKILRERESYKSKF